MYSYREGVPCNRYGSDPCSTLRVSDVALSRSKLKFCQLRQAVKAQVRVFKELPITDHDFPPPRPLSLLAREAWDRNAERIHAEGRWQTIDFELLALFCETLELYMRCRDEINEQCILVQGRPERELVPQSGVDADESGAWTSAAFSAEDPAC
jgi:phage terminase small subunit